MLSFWTPVKGTYTSRFCALRYIINLAFFNQFKKMIVPGKRDPIPVPGRFILPSVG
jgi:hypothetical protein